MVAAAAAAAAAECLGSMADEEESVLTLGSNPRRWPPGFRFHPTDEELVLYYLKRKICRRRMNLPVIGVVDVYKLEPWELPEKTLLRNGDKQWYFFSPRDRKYPNGSRSNRATKFGYWKATGKDRTISQNSRPVGNKKTLVHYQGRAPRGQRTDWVMHEYTMDEQALMECNNVQDCYALYKVFRKSGPGPKNGEQYGAPFREEEWDDEDGNADDSFKNRKDSEQKILENPCGDFEITDDMNILPIDDLEELLLQMSNEQDLIPQQHQGSAYASEHDAEAEVGSCIMEQSQIEPFSVEHSDAWCGLSSLETGYQIAQSLSASTSACVQPNEIPEVTSFANYSDHHQLQAIEEFLEINDIDHSKDSNRCVNDSSKEAPVNDIGGLDDPDDYFDASMFLAEVMAPLDGTSADCYCEGFGNEAQFQASHFTNELWTWDPTLDVSTAMKPDQIIVSPPASGTVSMSSVANPHVQIQEQASVRGASESWFSSTISAFLDSVPTSPAFASENTLINKALERMSSFGSGQSIVQAQNAATGGPPVDHRRGNRNEGFLFISFLVGLGAIFWVLIIGATFKVFKGLWGRFVSS